MLTIRKAKKFFYGIAILMAVFASQFVMGYENRIVSQSYFEDVSNQLTLDQVQSKEFSSYQNILTKGYSHSTFWLKLTIKSGVSDGGLVLRIRPSYMDEVELFDPTIDGKNARRRLTGDMYKWSSDEYQSLNLNFKIKSTMVDRDIYLRVKSAHTYMLHVDALDIKQAEFSDKKIEFIYLFYLAFLLVLVIWIFSTWMLNREKVLGLFALTQLVAVFYAASMFGFLRIILDQVLSAHLLNDITNYLIVSYISISLLAHSNLLGEYGLKKYFKWGLWFFIAIPIFSGTLIALGFVTEGLQINANSLLVATLFLPLTTFVGLLPSYSELERPLLPKSILRLYYILLLIILGITLLPMVGVISAIEFTLHGLFIHGLLSGLILFALLQYRTKRMNQSQMERIAFESSKAEQEKIRREDQGQLIGMLTHEVKNSLAVIDFAVSSIAEKFKHELSVEDKNLIRMSKAIDDINLVIARCVDVDRLDQEKIHAAIRPVNLSAFLQAISSEVADSDRIIWDYQRDILVDVDPDLLKVVIFNLIDNALKYAKDGSTIHVETSSSSQGRYIHIKNQVGYAGLPDEAKVFDKYYRSEKAQKNRGTGLGLWLSRSIVRLMNAELTYVSDGDVVTFSIGWSNNGK
jgi:signal transduction histidine kinase